MRKVLIRLGATLITATFVASLAAPTVAGQTRRTAAVSPSMATSVQRVKIVNFAFKPKTIKIKKGTKVKWKNAGSVNHTSTSNKRLWDSGPLAPGATFSHVFKKVGTFKYHCSIHPTLMHGKIVVT